MDSTQYIDCIDRAVSSLGFKSGRIHPLPCSQVLDIHTYLLTPTRLIIIFSSRTTFSRATSQSVHLFDFFSYPTRLDGSYPWNLLIVQNPQANLTAHSRHSTNSPKFLRVWQFSHLPHLRRIAYTSPAK